MSPKTPEKKDLTIDVASEEFYSEGLINFLLSSPILKFPWFLNVKGGQKIKSAFQSIDNLDQRLYAKLFARKNDWIRLKRINYFFVKDLKASIQHLESNGFVTTDYSKESLRAILELLEKEEVKLLSKEYKVDMKGNKSEMIDRLVAKCKTQKTILSMFGNGASSTERLMLKSVAKYLECVKLETAPRTFFSELLLLVTYPHYRGEESKRVSDLAKTLYEKGKGITVFHKYNIRPVDVFTTHARFSEYATSVQCVDEFITLKESKSWKEAYTLINQCKVDFILYMNNELNICYLTELKSKDMDYLMKFTAGRNLAYVLSKGIEVLKKESSSWEEAIEILNLLLKQQFFLSGARGHWYRELALVHEKKQDYERMVEALVEGLNDPKVMTNYSIVALIQKAESMAKRKALNDSAREVLLAAIPVCNYSPNTTTIMATSAPSVTTSKKQMFVKTTDKGKEYSIVEEVARSHYASELGYSSGIHDEGKLLVHCALACFWEIVFCDIEGVFHSELQSVPLDWGTSGFYRRRKDIIESLSEEIESEGAEEFLKKNVMKYRGVVGPVDWEVLDGGCLEEAQSFLRCLTTPVFLKIANYLLQDFRSKRSGLPDLTLWNPDTGKCNFVEVKGPSDTLSPNQIKWLEKLNEFGAAAEVCRVNTLNTGPREKVQNKRKLEENKSLNSGQKKTLPKKRKNENVKKD